MTEEQRQDLWEAMADLFLDTETRYLIPSVAGRCVRVGLPVGAARDIWRYEVTPAVVHNSWDIAGAWACWPRDWLVETIHAKRRRPGVCAALVYFLSAPLIEPVWQAIERCMTAL